MNKQLTDILNQLDIPAKRRDIDDISNVLWLGRNLPINNLDKIALVNQAMPMLKEIASREFKKMGVY